MSNTADAVIRQHVIWSVGAGLVPVPIADFVAVTAVQLDLIRQLCTLKGVSYEEGQGKVWVGALTGGTLARLGASALKALPGVGTILGGLSMSIASGASTYAVGQVVQQHLTAGGTLTDLDVEKARARYDAEYERGKAVATAARDEGAGGDVVARLEKLAALRDKGLITAEEYDAKKAQLLSAI